MLIILFFNHEINENTGGLSDDKICRLSYKENAGSPCIFPAKYYDELLNLPEKKGGGFLTKKYPAQVVLVPVRDEYELYDIDTPDDITRLLKFLH
jgi:molybdenum cofactor cytidylyltransferase